MRLLRNKLDTSPLEERPKCWDTNSPMVADANRYWHLLGKLIYLIVTRLDITYVVSVLSQLMQEPRMVHCEFSHSNKDEKGFYVDAMIIFIERPILMLDMLGTKEIKNLLQGITHM